jgi:gluconate 5-dehydrogenase
LTESKLTASSFSLDGLVAVVTGASRGIGAEIAGGLCKAGALVHGVARSAVPQDTVKNQERYHYHSADVKNIESVNQLVKTLERESGSVDILVNAAGISFAPDNPQNSVDDFNAVIQVNLVSAYRMTCAFRPMFSHGSSIINIGSLGGLQGFSNNPGYVASKFGIRGLTKALAMDYAEAGIRVNCLIPGYINTKMTETSFSDPKLSSERVERSMLGRWGETRDLIGAAVFLASSAAEFVTGSDLVVDGGWSSKGL